MVRVGADPVTVQEYISERWIPRRRCDNPDGNWPDEAAIFKNHIFAEIGAEPMATIPHEKLVALRDVLNFRSGLQRTDDAYLAPKTAQNFWGVVAKACHDSANRDAGHADPSDPKSARLHVRDDDPAAGIAPPKSRGKRQKSSLWPNEVAALLACASVPLHWRVLHAFALYSGLRQSEQRALLVGDVDLDHLLISVTKKISRRTGKVGPRKTKAVGYCPIEANVAPLIRALCEGRDASERLLWMPPEEDLASQLRLKHLPAAGISRADLFTDDGRHLPYTFHRHRTTHLSWRCGRGDNPSDLIGTVLHSDFETTMVYIDRAVLNALRREREKLFAPLPADLVEAARGGIDPERTRALAKNKKRDGGGGSGGGIALISPEISPDKVQFPLGSPDSRVRTGS
jgi:integrase